MYRSRSPSTSPHLLRGHDEGWSRLLQEHQGNSLSTEPVRLPTDDLKLLKPAGYHGSTVKQLREGFVCRIVAQHSYQLGCLRACVREEEGRQI